MRDFSADYILFLSFEIRGYILNNHKILIGLESCFKSSLLIFWVTFEIYFYFSAAGVVLCGSRKSLPVHHPKCRLYFISVLCDQRIYSE